MVVNEMPAHRVEQLLDEGYEYVEVGYGVQFVPGHGWVAFLVLENGWGADGVCRPRKTQVVDRPREDYGQVFALACRTAQQEADRYVGDYAVRMQFYDKNHDVAADFERFCR